MTSTGGCGEPEECRPERDEKRYPHWELTQRIIACAIEVHRSLGPGFLESFYKRAMAIEMKLQNLEFQEEAPFQVHYRGQLLGYHPADFDVERKVLVETKAISDIVPKHHAIGYSYLKAAKRRVLLLINFQVTVLKDGIERLVLKEMLP